MRSKFGDILSCALPIDQMVVTNQTISTFSEHRIEMLSSTVKDSGIAIFPPYLLFGSSI